MKLNGTKKEMTTKFIIVYKGGERGGGTVISLNQGIVSVFLCTLFTRCCERGRFIRFLKTDYVFYGVVSPEEKE